MTHAYHKVGLTGGIGTGKSTVSKRLSVLGARVLDADAVSRALLAPGGACVEAVTEAFGVGVLASKGVLDRKMIASIVFMEPRMRKVLNDIVHPAVRAQMDADYARISAEDPGALIVYDVPLLFECGWDRDMERNILVTADEDIVLKRVVKRDKSNEDDVRARIAAQMPEAVKRRYADYVLDNNGTLEALYEKVDALYRGLTEAKA